ncbi:MAG TPA: GNVR domain-containing protein, partial [Mangrovimonas sp.]|nr:GNVR domain-containing protein [Mangrovimonas sp.]
MSDDFLDNESHEPKGITFDFKGFLFKILNLWKVVFVSVGLALIIAYFINVRKQNVYKMESLISIESEQNSFFTSTTSISFNWGGVSGKVSKVMTSLKTRTHNEKVVDSLKFFMEYLVQGKYRLVDVYTNAPFEVIIDCDLPQILNAPIQLTYIDQNTFELSFDFKTSYVPVQYYNETKKKGEIAVSPGIFTQTFRFGQTIRLPFFNATVVSKPGQSIKPGSTYFVRFSNFDSVVSHYQNSIKVDTYSKNSQSVLVLSLTGHNKKRLVDYLNATSVILSRSELNRKNLYATNTIKFIDSTLSTVNNDLKAVTDEMNNFRKNNKVFDVSAEMQQVSERLKNYERDKEQENIKLNYLDALETYLRTKTDYTKIAAPSSVGIAETNILNSVSKITALAIERQNLEYTTKEGNVLFKDLDRQIDAEKNVLLETIKSTKEIINVSLSTINRSIAQMQAMLSTLPEDQQEFLKIQRKLDISQEAYNLFQAKRSEAAIIKAASVSDIVVIDEAKDIGGGLIGPNKSLNYMMALMIGFFLPMFLIFVIFLLDTTIHGSDEVERLSRIPIIGLIGKYRYQNNLVVFEKPKSAVAESFRAIRSSIQFLLYKLDKENGKTIMITSSVSGE